MLKIVDYLFLPFSVLKENMKSVLLPDYEVAIYVANRVLCVTLNGQFFQILGSDTKIDGSFFGSSMVRFKCNEKHWVCDIATMKH